MDRPSLEIFSTFRTVKQANGITINETNGLPEPPNEVCSVVQFAPGEISIQTSEGNP
jgi:hypothetical protein